MPTEFVSSVQPSHPIRDRITTIPAHAAKLTGRRSTDGYALRETSMRSLTLIERCAILSSLTVCCQPTTAAITCIPHPRDTASWVTLFRFHFLLIEITLAFGIDSRAESFRPIVALITDCAQQKIRHRRSAPIREAPEVGERRRSKDAEGRRE